MMAFVVVGDLDVLAHNGGDSLQAVGRHLDRGQPTDVADATRLEDRADRAYQAGVHRRAEAGKEVLNGLFVQGNAGGLVALARKEKDLQMKKLIVSKLSVINKKEATDYLLEILNK